MRKATCLSLMDQKLLLSVAQNMHKIGQKRSMNLQTTQEVATVTKTKYLIDLFM